MSIFTHLRKARNAGIRKSMLKHRQKKANILKAKLAVLYREAAINNIQREAIAKLRVKHTQEARELAEKYMEKEIEIIEDLGNKYISQVGTKIIKAKA